MLIYNLDNTDMKENRPLVFTFRCSFVDAVKPLNSRLKATQGESQNTIIFISQIAAAPPTLLTKELSTAT